MRVAIFFSAILLFVLAVALLPMSGPAEAVTKSGEPIVVRSAHGVIPTVQALEASLRRRGVSTVVKVEQSASATLVLFADPHHTADASARALDALDLPLRALVYMEGDFVSIAYDDPKALVKRHGLSADEAAAAGRAVAAVVAEAAGS
ncbi:hypothetical protein [Methylopila sp. 73B]|uniref:hypothetical protein n=1 Tax=Methylopila sp. 73B TaxID=1120792 RepID=UPI0003794C90|nr:hypothetical protein [Methylopila sp. 73B]